MNIGSAVAETTSQVVSSQGGHHHDTHALPPAFIQQAHWHYASVKRAALDADEDVIDFGRGLTAQQMEALRPVSTIAASTTNTACRAYKSAYLGSEQDFNGTKEVTIFEHRDFPGLRILPGLLPPEIQVLFTSQILHRELADERHKNNLMPDYTIPFPSVRTGMDHARSFFTYPQNASTGANLIPKAIDRAKPLNMAQFLTSKLRWLTIGDQYDWPTRSYTRDGPSAFPSDLAKLVQGIFPEIRPQSGVVLLYSGKDYMPVHRDVSEECQTALASFSLGCDGIFIVARGEDDGEGDNTPRTLAIRVKSGDCIHLDGEARWAWHAMARTIVDTCPEHLSQWPKETPGATAQEKKAYTKWQGFMAGKRLNISCRQVWD